MVHVLLLRATSTTGETKVGFHAMLDVSHRLLLCYSRPTVGGVTEEPPTFGRSTSGCGAGPRSGYVQQLAAALSESDHDVTLASGGEEAIARLPDADIDLVLTDLQMGRVGGIEVLEAARRLRPDVPVVVLTGHGTINDAVEAMRKGALDFLTKPVDLDRLDLVIARVVRNRELMLENTRLRKELASQNKRAGAGPRLIGESPAIKTLLADIERIATTTATVLVLGESGTGKELVADYIHACSLRNKAPLVRVNCAALAEGVLESELFGHERGAYTGAVRAHRGRFEAAHGGTLFLDEIGDLSVSSQLKLLRALQERSIERVGSNQPIAVDVRVIAATNRDLRSAVAEGQFREELFYRLSVVVLHVPSLRERRSDVPLLGHAFLTEFAARHGRGIEGFSDEARRHLASHDWPGNVRELRNAVESMVVRAAGPLIEAADVDAWFAETPERGEISLPVGRPLEEIDLAYIERTLDSVGGNKTQAARLLGIGTKTLYRKLERSRRDEDEG